MHRADMLTHLSDMHTLLPAGGSGGARRRRGLGSEGERHSHRQAKILIKFLGRFFS